MNTYHVFTVEAVCQTAPAHWRIILSVFDTVYQTRDLVVAETMLIPMVVADDLTYKQLRPGAELLCELSHPRSYNHDPIVLVQKGKAGKEDHRITTINHQFLSPQEIPWRGEEAV